MIVLKLFVYVFGIAVIRMVARDRRQDADQMPAIFEDDQTGLSVRQSTQCRMDQRHAGFAASRSLVRWYPVASQFVHLLSAADVLGMAWILSADAAAIECRRIYDPAKARRV